MFWFLRNFNDFIQSQVDLEGIDFLSPLTLTTGLDLGSRITTKDAGLSYKSNRAKPVLHPKTKQPQLSTKDYEFQRNQKAQVRVDRLLSSPDSGFSVNVNPLNSVEDDGESGAVVAGLGSNKCKNKEAIRLQERAQFEILKSGEFSDELRLFY